MAANVTAGFCNKYSFQLITQHDLNQRIFIKLNCIFDIYQMCTRNTSKTNNRKKVWKLKWFFLMYFYCRLFDFEWINSYVWMMSITTMPKVNDDWNPLTGWPFHDKPPMQPRNINIAVPINSAKNIANASTVFFPILNVSFTNLAGI